jgi:hypothetical protein
MRALFVGSLVLLCAACSTTERELAPNLTCDGGDCGCAQGFATCSAGTCATHLTEDPESCGACGHSCLGGSCVDGRCGASVLTHQATALHDFAIDDSAVYVASDSAITRIPLDGSATENADLQGGTPAGSLVTARGKTYYGVTIGAVQSAFVYTWATKQSAQTPSTEALFGTFQSTPKTVLWWQNIKSTTSIALERYHLDDDTLEELTGLGTPGIDHSWGVDDDTACWPKGHAVLCVDLNAPTPKPVTPFDGTPTDELVYSVSLRRPNVYLSTDKGLYRAPADASAPATRIGPQRLAAAIEVDDTGVYVATHDGTIIRLNDGLPVTTLAIGQALGPARIVLSKDAIHWATGEVVLRLAK